MKREIMFQNGNTKAIEMSVFTKFIYKLNVISIATSLYCCYNKLSQLQCLETMKSLSYSSGGQKSNVSFTGLKYRCQHRWFLLEASGENALSCFFQLPMATCPPWLWRLSQAHHSVCCCHHPTFSSNSDSPVFLCEDFCDYTVPRG